MMECAIDHGVNDTAEIASITLCAAAETADVTEDYAVITGGVNLLRFWAYGEGLKEWLGYSSVDGILDRASHPSLDVWYASPELLDALPEMVEAFPSILQSAPDILLVREACLGDSPTEAVPTMSM